MTFSERDSQVIWHPYTQMHTAKPAIAITHAEGAYLYAENGDRYIDAVSSWWVNIHGHAHPHIAQAVAKQATQLEQVIFAGFTHPQAVILAEELLKVIPNNQRRVFYSDNGSTAVEVALKMALQFWHNQQQNRLKIIAFEDAYHGDTFGAMSVSGRSAFTAPFNDLLFEVEYIVPPTPGNETISINQLQQIIAENKNQIAAFIFEPLILGSGGMLMYEAAYLDQLMKICSENQVLTIADEVMTGFGRTGKWFACSHLTQKPDMMCFSKGITGGTMALGVTTCSQPIYDAFLSEDKLKTLFHGHSFTANSLACAAAVANFEIMHRTETWDQVKRIENKHQQFLSKIKTHTHIAHIRQCGTILAMEIQTSQQTSYFSNIRDRMYNYFIQHQILLRPLGNVLYILPPYCISNEDLDWVYEKIEDFLNDL